MLGSEILIESTNVKRLVDLAVTAFGLLRFFVFHL